MVAFGIVAGIFIISIEIAYKRHRRLKEKELELAKTAADRWRGNIEVRCPFSCLSFALYSVPTISAAPFRLPRNLEYIVLSCIICRPTLGPKLMAKCNLVSTFFSALQ